MISNAAVRPVLSPQHKRQLHLHDRLKLQIELVPALCHYKNVRSNVRKSQWDKIRRQVYVKADYRCDICGKRGTLHPVECHEVWVYNEKTAVQKLKGFRAVCPLCHEVIHFGRAEAIGNRERALGRFIKMNKLKRKDAEEIIEAVWQRWKSRNFIHWKLDIEHLTKYKTEIPE